MNCDGLMQNVVKPRACWAGRRDRRCEGRRAGVVGKTARMPPTSSSSAMSRPGGRKALLEQPCPRRTAARADGSRGRSARSDGGASGAPIRPRARASAHPGATPWAQDRRPRTSSARRQTRGRVPPEPFPRGEMLVEQGAAPVERDAERLVLVAVPAHGRLHDEAAFGEQVERAELACEQERVPQRRDHRTGGEPQSGRHGGDRREEDERARPGHRRILVPRHRVVPRVAHDPARPGARAEHDVLAHHHGVEPRLLRDDGHLDERPQVARRRQRPVLAEDEDELRRAQWGTPRDERRGRVDRSTLVRRRAPGPAPRPGRRTDRRSPPRGRRAPRSRRGRRTGRARPSSRPRARRRGGRRRAAPQRRAAARSSRRTRRPEAASARAGRARRRRSRTRSRSAPARRLERRDDDPIERGEVGAGARARGQRDVERRARPAPAPVSPSSPERGG